MAELRRCTRCVFPKTHETIPFDSEGVCNICRQHKYKQTQIDWTPKKKERDVLIAAHRGKSDYGCIIPLQRRQRQRLDTLLSLSLCHVGRTG